MNSIENKKFLVIYLFLSTLSANARPIVFHPVDYKNTVSINKLLSCILQLIECNKPMGSNKYFHPIARIVKNQCEPKYKWNRIKHNNKEESYSESNIRIVPRMNIDMFSSLVGSGIR